MMSFRTISHSLYSVAENLLLLGTFLIRPLCHSVLKVRSTRIAAEWKCRGRRSHFHFMPLPEKRQPPSFLRWERRGRGQSIRGRQREGGTEGEKGDLTQAPQSGCGEHNRMRTCGAEVNGRVAEEEDEQDWQSGRDELCLLRRLSRRHHQWLFRVLAANYLSKPVITTMALSRGQSGSTTATLAIGTMLLLSGETANTTVSCNTSMASSFVLACLSKIHQTSLFTQRQYRFQPQRL